MDWFYFTKLFLASYFSCVALIYIVRLTIADSTPNTAKIFTGNKYSKTWWNHMLFRLFRILIWGICVTRVFLPSLDSYIVTFPSLMAPIIMLIGTLMMVSGFSLALLAHKQLGKEWRSGIDPRGPNKICMHGVYRYSRNPMYIGVVSAQTGFFLALPSLFTAVCLVIGITTIVRQIVAEERHLLAVLPTEYNAYVGKVPRFL